VGLDDITQMMGKEKKRRASSRKDLRLKDQSSWLIPVSQI